MLNRVEILDFALIEQAVLLPAPGLFVISGETGAGKSILIDAISSLSGERVGKDEIRRQASRFRVEAVFDQVKDRLPPDLLDQLGLNDTDEPSQPDELIIAREVNSSGKSTCRINGRLVPLSALREVTRQLIDIHGQNDQQGIFDPVNHRRLLDRFAGSVLADVFQGYHRIVESINQLQRQLQLLGTDPAERERQLDLLRFQIQEIEAAQPDPQEEPKLVERHRLLSHREKVLQAAGFALDVLQGQEDQSLDARLSIVLSTLDPASRASQMAASARELVSQARDSLSDASGLLHELIDREEEDPGELERIDERLDLLYRLKKKYGGELSRVLEFLEQARTQFEALSDGEARFARLGGQLEKTAAQLYKQADQIRSIRRQSADRLEHLIAAELEDLGMKGVQFAVQMEPITWSSGSVPKHGLDKISFMISANPGEPLKPLARIASGGEASRVLLAIKTILASADETPVLIFDEIDTGVSGITASRVAEKLHHISRHHQVFCITHMAQIAAMADQHILIEKTSSDNRTVTQLSELKPQERVQELMRLLSGGRGDDKARDLAEHLLAEAAAFKLKS